MKSVSLILYLLLLSTLLLYAYPVIDNDQIANWNHPSDPSPTTVLNTAHTTLPTRTISSTPTATASSSESDSYPIYGNDHAITTQMAVLGSVFIVLGLYLVGFGFRGFHVTLAAFGFLAIGLVTWVGLTNCQSSNGYINNDITMIVVPAGLGVAGAILFFFLWTFSFYLIGAMGGLALGLFICCWKENLVIESLVARACFLAAMCVAFAALTFFVEHYMILFATSFVGAYLFFVGVDVLARTGYVAGIRSIIDRNPLHTVHYVLDRDVYLLLSFTIVLFLISFAWQALINHGRHFGIRYVRHHHAGGGLKSAAITALAAAATAAAATHLADEHREHHEHHESRPASPPPASGSTHEEKHESSDH